MPSAIPLSCRCGAMRGVVADVAPETGNHLVCHCDDCQAFAHFLDRADVLDAQGGTDILQTAPARVRITSGYEHLRSMRLSEKGILRWYVQCCRTPIGNTVSARIPFVGFPRVCLDEALAASGRTPAAVLGAPVGIHARFARGGSPPGAHPAVPPRVILRAVALLARWWIADLGQPSPFFDPRTNEPRVAPTILNPEERERLRARMR